MLSDDQLYELLVAVILRNNGYIAGVPRRALGGRATKHQVNVIAIDINNTPFTFNNIIIVRGSCEQDESPDLDMVRSLKATVTDLAQTLPPKRELIRDVAGTDRGDLFHRIYGKQKDREKFTVNYVGCIFISKAFNQNAWEYANANGIYIIYLPSVIAGHHLKYWFDLLKDHLNSVIDHHGSFTLPGLIKKEKKHAAFKEVINLLGDKKSCQSLKPEQYHDLFTIINEVLNKSPFTLLQNKLQQLMLASMNGYPVVFEHNLNYRNLFEATLISLREHFSRAKSVSQRTKYRPLSTIKFWVTGTKFSLDKNVAVLNYEANSSETPEPIKNMQGQLFVPFTVLNRRLSRFQLKLPIKTGVSLIGEFYLTEKAQQDNHRLKAVISRQ